MPTLQINKARESYARGLIAGQILRSVEGVMADAFKVIDHTEDSDEEMTTIVISVSGAEGMRDIEVLIAPVGVIKDDDEKSEAQPEKKATHSDIEQRIFLVRFRGYDLCRWCSDPIYNDGTTADPTWMSGKSEEATCADSPNAKHDPSGDKVGE